MTAGDETTPGTATAVTIGETIMADAIATLSYHPPGGTPVTRDYASFTYTVSDGMASSTPASTLNIHIVSTQQLAAIGAPTVTVAEETVAYAEDNALNASTTGITEYNLINADTVTWQWQWGYSADGAFFGLAGATEAAFTPTQEHVGLYVRACASFMDQHSTPASEGPLCSASGQVTNVNDAPVSRDNFVWVFTSADADTPYLFTSADFPITDEDGDNSGQRHHRQPAHQGHPESGHRPGRGRQYRGGRRYRNPELLSGRRYRSGDGLRQLWLHRQ